MSIPQVLEVAIGLILVYYFLGAIVSLVTRWINEFFETRAVALEKYLLKIVGSQNGSKNLHDFLSLPQLHALRPIRYKNIWSFITANTVSKKVEKIPVPLLVDSFFDVMGLTASKNTDLSLIQLAELVDKLPESETKQAFIGWINQGITHLDDLRSRTTAYFSGLMEQAASKFRANARSFVIMLSIFVTMIFGTDSIQLAQNLWNNAELRALAVAKADMVVQQEGTDASLDDLIQELGDLSFKFGWWATERPTTNSTQDWALFIGLKVVGLTITVAAVSQGSSFWYDLLKKLVAPAKGPSSPDSEPKG